MVAVYVVSNPAWPNWIKVGSTKSRDQRLASYNFNSPLKDYELIHILDSEHGRRVESDAVLQLQGLYAHSGEWIRCSVKQARAAILSAAGKEDEEVGESALENAPPPKPPLCPGCVERKARARKRKREHQAKKELARKESVRNGTAKKVRPGLDRECPVCFVGVAERCVSLKDMKSPIASHKERVEGTPAHPGRKYQRELHARKRRERT